MGGVQPTVQPRAEAEGIRLPAALQPAMPPRLPLAAQPIVKTRVEIGRGRVLRIDFSPDWQAVMEDLLLENGWASEAGKKRLRVTDNAGKPVGLFGGQQARVPPPSSFPLSIEQLPPISGRARAARGGA